MKDARYDLEDRLLEFAVRVIRVTESISRSRAGAYVGDQLKVCHKELRESRRWWRLAHRAPLVENPERLETLLAEADELVRLFTASIRTASSNGMRRDMPAAKPRRKALG